MGLRLVATGRFGMFLKLLLILVADQCCQWRFGIKHVTRLLCVVLDTITGVGALQSMNPWDHLPFTPSLAIVTCVHRSSDRPESFEFFFGNSFIMTATCGMCVRNAFLLLPFGDFVTPLLVSSSQALDTCMLRDRFTSMKVTFGVPSSTTRLMTSHDGFHVCPLPLGWICRALLHGNW